MCIPEFFWKAEGLCLTPGNKTAGFSIFVDPSAALRLHQIEATDADIKRLAVQTERCLLNSGIASVEQARGARVKLHGSGSCPAYFVESGPFGGSIGASPEVLAKLSLTESSDSFWPYIEYTPHNVDAPVQAIRLFILAQTWGEWAYTQMLAGVHRSRS